MELHWERSALQPAQQACFMTKYCVVLALMDMASVKSDEYGPGDFELKSDKKATKKCV